MKTVGIVAEYNPFHLGHAYQIRESLRLAHDDAAVIAVMSGDYVQRGEASVFSKYARAEAACRCGADLVVELPLPWSIASAERFADGAVRLLADLGADTLSFGSETADQAELEELAALLAEPSFLEETKASLKRDPNQSFASARQKAAEKHRGKPLPTLQQPNNILALEYLKAVQVHHLSMTPLTVRRFGAGHDESGEENGFLSASEIRRRLRRGERTDCYFPDRAAEVFQRETETGRTVFDQERQDLMLLSRLRFLGEEDFCSLPDAGDGLGKRIWSAVRTESSYEGVLRAAATRRYPASRVRRCCLAAVLGIKESLKEEAIPYARILAFNERGRAVLRRAEASGRVPLLTKPAQVSEMGEKVQTFFQLGARAHDFYTLGFTGENERVCGEDWRKGPAVCI